MIMLFRAIPLHCGRRKGISEFMMKLMTALLLLVPSLARAQQDMVGRRYEILELNVHACKQPMRNSCTLVGRGEFIVTGIVAGEKERYFQVQTRDKSKGYIPVADKDDIYCVDPKIGMRSAEVTEGCLGQPKSVERTTTAYSVHEMWVYPKEYLFFDDDRLTAIHETVR